MTDISLNGKNALGRLDNSELEGIVGGYTDEELAELVRRVEANTSGEDDFSSDKPFEDGLGRKKPGSMGWVKR